MHPIFRWLLAAKRYTVFVTAALAVSALSHSIPAQAFAVTVVKDTDLKPYQDAILGFKSACLCTVNEVDLLEGEGAEAVLGTKPDVIVAVGTNSFRKVRSIQDRPMIYLMVMPSETAALSPNISGVSMDISPDAYLTTIRQMFPHARKIGVLYDLRHTGSFVEEAAEIADRMGIELVMRSVSSAREVSGVLKEMRNAVDILWMIPDSTVVNPETVDSIMLFSFQNRVPVFSFSRKYVEMGAVAALQANPFDMGVQAAEIAKALSEGRKAPLRPYANGYHLFINRKVAEKMGLRFNPDIVRKAE